MDAGRDPREETLDRPDTDIVSVAPLSTHKRRSFARAKTQVNHLLCFVSLSMRCFSSFLSEYIYTNKNKKSRKSTYVNLGEALHKDGNGGRG